MGIRHGGSRCIELLAISVAFGLGSATPAAAQQNLLPMRVVSYDYAGVPAPLLQQAQRVVETMFHPIGVQVVWLDVPEFARQTPGESAARRAFVASVLQVNIVPFEGRREIGLTREAAGAAVPGTRTAWISWPNVLYAARRGKLDSGDVLGSVIAHELSHLLLPAHAHAVAGLMRDDLDLTQIAQGWLPIRGEQASLIRTELARRNARATTQGEMR